MRGHRVHRLLGLFMTVKFKFRLSIPMNYGRQLTPCVLYPHRHKEHRTVMVQYGQAVPISEDGLEPGPEGVEDAMVATWRAACRLRSTSPRKREAVVVHA